MIISAARTSGMGSFRLAFFIGRIKGWQLEPERLLGLMMNAGERQGIFYALWGTVERIYRIQRKSTENIRGGLLANSQNNSYFFGQVEQKGSSYLRHAETKKDNLSIPCAYRCLEYLPPFTFQC